MESQGAASPGILILTTSLSKPFLRLDKYVTLLQELERHMEVGGVWDCWAGSAPWCCQSCSQSFKRHFCLLVFEHRVAKSTHHISNEVSHVPQTLSTFQIKSENLVEESEECCGNALPALHPSTSSKMGHFQHKLKQSLGSGCSCCLFAQSRINLCFCYHLMRFLSLATHSCSLQAHSHPLPQGCAPGWRQSCTAMGLAASTDTGVGS